MAPDIYKKPRIKKREAYFLSPIQTSGIFSIINANLGSCPDSAPRQLTLAAAGGATFFR